jgi:hypothetical protein
LDRYDRIGLQRKNDERVKMKEPSAFDVLKRYNTFNGLNESEIEFVKVLCESDRKLIWLTKRYLETGSNHTLGTLIDTFDKMYKSKPMSLEKLNNAFRQAELRSMK